MLASTQPVRLLRPQALPAKLAAVGATSMAVNVPCGMWREHCEKFSGHWFLAVHASIPFIAMLRKVGGMLRDLSCVSESVGGCWVIRRLRHARSSVSPATAQLACRHLPSVFPMCTP